MASRRGTLVQYFDPKRIKLGDTVIILGQTDSGKSILEYHLLSLMAGWFSYGISFTPTHSSKEMFARIMPRAFIHDPNKAHLESHINSIRRFSRARTRKGRDPRGNFIIFDDTAGDSAFMRSKAFDGYLFKNRHDKCSVLMTLQACKTISPAARENCKIVFAFYTANLAMRKDINQLFFGMLKPREFDELFDEATQNYGCLVLDKKAAAKSREWRDYIFWFRATLPEDIPRFKLCDENFFKLDRISNTHVEEEDDDEADAVAAAEGQIVRLTATGDVLHEVL